MKWAVVIHRYWILGLPCSDLLFLAGGGASIESTCCPSLGVGTPVVVAVDDTEGAESVGAFRSGAKNSKRITLAFIGIISGWS